MIGAGNEELALSVVEVVEEAGADGGAAATTSSTFSSTKTPVKKSRADSP
jgi:hypothetical protein